MGIKNCILEWSDKNTVKPKASVRFLYICNLLSLLNSKGYTYHDVGSEAQLIVDKLIEGYLDKDKLELSKLVSYELSYLAFSMMSNVSSKDKVKKIEVEEVAATEEVVVEAQEHEHESIEPEYLTEELEELKNNDPEDELLSQLKPEDFKPIEYDVEYLERLGIEVGDLSNE